MERSNHSFSELFDELGLASSPGAINHFILHHSLPSSAKLSQAVFWTDQQATFIEHALEGESDWSEVVEQLDAMLRH